MTAIWIDLWEPELKLLQSLVMAFLAEQRTEFPTDFSYLSRNNRITVAGLELSVYTERDHRRNPRTEHPNDTIVEVFGDHPWMLRIPGERHPCGILPRSATLHGDRTVFDRDLVLLKMFVPTDEDA